MIEKQKLKGEWNYENKRYIISYDKNIKKKANDIILTPEELIKDITSHNRKILLSIKDGKIKKDYLNLINSVKQNLQMGEIVGTKEALIKKFEKRDYHLESLKKSRQKILDKIYMCVVESSQAFLLSNNTKITSPRNLINELKKKMKSNNNLEKAKKVIEAFKDYEHEKRELPHGKELTKLIKYSQEYYEEVKRIL